MAQHLQLAVGQTMGIRECGTTERVEAGQVRRRPQVGESREGRFQLQDGRGLVAHGAAGDDTGSTAAHIAALAVAAAAGGITAYAARQSGHHRDREVESRRLELELKAFGPFTNDLADPDAAPSAYADASSRARSERLPKNRRSVRTR